MKLNRALELCQQPLDATRSHMVKVNRHALIHMLDEAAKRAETIKSQASEIQNWKATVDKSEQKVRELKEKLEESGVE